MENVLHAGPSGLHIFINDYDRCTIPKKKIIIKNIHEMKSKCINKDVYIPS